MTPFPEKPDHGEFTLHSAQEGILLVQLEERASKNPENPGQAWGRIEGTRTIQGRTEKGVKLYHVNQQTRQVTVTEEWAGTETARMTVALADHSVETAPTEPTPPPDPGPTTPSFYRRPFHGADLLPEEDLQRWLLTRADRDVTQISVLPRRIRLVGEGFQEIIGLPHPLAANIAPGTGATLRAVFARPGVDRRFVEGWFGSVDGKGTAWVVEVAEDNAWWIATRTFDRRPGVIGRWTGDWFQRAGIGVEQIPSLFRAILAPPAGEEPIVLGKPGTPPAPDIGMTGGQLLPNEPVPDTAESVADRVGRDWEAKLPLGQSPVNPMLTVFRGNEWETWTLDDDLPMGLDDMIRAICARGAKPTSVALVQMGVIPLEGEVYRALLTDGESAGRRYTRALLIGMAPDGVVLGFRLAMCDRGEMGDEGWIGVEPISEMSLYTKGVGEA